jgi:hypothetical protein
LKREKTLPVEIRHLGEAEMPYFNRPIVCFISKYGYVGILSPLSFVDKPGLHP